MISPESIIDQLAGMTIREATEVLQAAIEMLQYTRIVTPIDLRKDGSARPESLADDEVSRSPS